MKSFIRILFYVLLLTPFLFSSCSEREYACAIPSNCIALLSVDVSKVPVDKKATTMLEDIFKVDDLTDCGVDFSNKVYAFETADGNFGVCARVADEGKLEDCIGRYAGNDRWTPLTERSGIKFTTLNRVWLVGYSDRAMLVMGPVAEAGQAEACRRMVKYLGQDEETSVVSTKMYECLDSMVSPISLVAQCRAMPEKFIAPFMFGVPKDTDVSQVFVAADISIADGCLDISGKTFSFDSGINAAISKSLNVFRGIGDRYVDCMSIDTPVGFFINVAGHKFLPLVQANKSLQILLAGLNTAIDMDNILRSVDGNMSITFPSISSEGMFPSLCAELSGAPWLADIDYWKQSCTPGTRIIDWQADAYRYVSGKTSFYFGVTEDKQFYSGGSPDIAISGIRPSETPLAPSVKQNIIGRKMALVFNLSPILGSNNVTASVLALVEPVMGNVRTIVYSLK